MKTKFWENYQDVLDRTGQSITIFKTVPIRSKRIKEVPIPLPEEKPAEPNTHLWIDSIWWWL